MTAPLPIVVLPRAGQDIADAADRYVDEAGDAVAQRFADALGEAFDLLARNPGTARCVTRRCSRCRVCAAGPCGHGRN